MKFTASGETALMPRGKDLISDDAGHWNSGGTMLLLNPRMDAQWRSRIMSADFPDLPDHVWLATSGTGGVLKLVALSRNALEASARAVNSHLAVGRGDVWINPLPLFHVGGLGIVVRACLSDVPWHRSGPWNPEHFVRTAEACRATLSSLVPAQVHDLVRLRLAASPKLRAVIVGGAALDESLRTRAEALGWPLLASYGLTEACSQVATADPRAADSTWLPLLGHMQARTDDAGILELHGSSLLTGWMIFDGAPARWEDPKRDGWYRTTDRAELRGRLLRVLGRSDDLLKIRGELVDVASLERALQARVPSGLVCVRAVPDARNGFILHVVAESSEAAKEAAAASEVFPPFARPQTVEVGAIRRTASGKIMRE